MSIEIKTDPKTKKMSITVDLAEENFKKSNSGKNLVISTGGNIPVSGTEYKLGLNLMKKA